MTVIELGKRFTAAALTGTTFFAQSAFAEEDAPQVPTEDPERDSYSAALDAFADAAQATSDIPVFTIDPSPLQIPRAEADVVANILSFEAQYNEQFPGEEIDVFSNPYDTMLALILTDIALPNRIGINSPGAFDPLTFQDAFQGLEDEMRTNPAANIAEIKMFTGIEFTLDDFANTESQIVLQGADKCTIFMPSEGFMDTDFLFNMVSSLPLGAYDPLNISGVDHIAAIGYHEGEHCNPVDIPYDEQTATGTFILEALADQAMHERMSAEGKEDIADRLVMVRAIDAFADPTHASSAVMDVSDPEELAEAYDQLQQLIDIINIKLNGWDDPRFDELNEVEKGLIAHFGPQPADYMLTDPVHVYTTVSETLLSGELDHLPYAKAYAEDFLHAVDTLTTVDDMVAEEATTTTPTEPQPQQPAQRLRP